MNRVRLDNKPGQGMWMITVARIPSFGDVDNSEGIVKTLDACELNSQLLTKQKRHCAFN